MNLQVPLRWQMLALAAGIGFLLYLLAPILTPFAIAAMFAYMCDPLADRLERLRLSRTAAVSIVFVGLLLIVTLVLVLLIPFLEQQITRFLSRLPDWIESLQNEAAPWLHEHFGMAPDFLETDKLIAIAREHWTAAGGAAQTVLAQMSKSGLAVVAWIAHLVLIPVVTFYLMRDWDVLVSRVHELLPRTIEQTATRLARESNEVLGAFVRGQVSVMLVLGVFYGLGLWLVGIDVGPLIGFFAGLISFVPYLGAILGVLAGVIAALMQYHDGLHLVLVLGVFVVGHLIESYVLVPRLVGDKIGLHPVAVMFAILVGGHLFGFLGVLLALPAASVVMVLLRYAHEQYRLSELYRTTHVFVGSASSPADPVVVVVSEDCMTSDKIVTTKKS